MINQDCRRCHGKGWYWVPNGPDDVERELCEYCFASVYCSIDNN